MNVLAILRVFALRCKSVFENTTTKKSKRFVNWLILTMKLFKLVCLMKFYRTLANNALHQ